MGDRYGVCEDGHTAWMVVDRQNSLRVVSRHHMEQDARAEAARLNAGAPKRAVPVKAWARVSHGEIKPTTVHWSRHEVAADINAFLGDRIARVEIREISDAE